MQVSDYDCFYDASVSARQDLAFIFSYLALSEGIRTLGLKLLISKRFHARGTAHCGTLWHLRRHANASLTVGEIVGSIASSAYAQSRSAWRAEVSSPLRRRRSKKPTGRLLGATVGSNRDCPTTRFKGAARQLRKECARSRGGMPWKRRQGHKEAARFDTRLCLSLRGYGAGATSWAGPS